MEWRLIKAAHKVALSNANAVGLADEIARVRTAVSAPSTWRLDPSLKGFYNPDGMSQAEISTYELRQTTIAEKTERSADTLLNKRLRKVETWCGILTDADPDGSDDCVWLSHSTAFPPTFKLKVRKNNTISTLLTFPL